MTEFLDELRPDQARAAAQRVRIMVYQPGHRAKGKVAREIDLLADTWQLDDLNFRQVRTVTGETAVLATATTGAGRAALDQEIRIGNRLWLTVDDPPVLSRLLGFDDDGEANPPVALIARSGTPLAKAAAQLSGSDRQQVALTLLAALDQLSRARVVHRALSPQTVLWDWKSQVAQVTTFSRAAVLGEPRSGPSPDVPWYSPEQASGVGPTARGDDLYTAALLLFWVFTAETPTTDPAGMRRRLALADEELRRRLDGMFADSPASRPTLEELTRRWQPRVASAPVSRRRDDDARREFAALRQRQRADATPLRDPSAVSLAQVPPNGRLIALIVGGLVLVAGLIALIVTLTGG